MKTIKVLGSGCLNCQTTHHKIQSYAKEHGLEVELIKIEDFQQIMTYDVMTTPAVVIDEQVVHKGSVPSTEKIASWF